MPPPSPKPDDRDARTARWPWIGAGLLLAVFILLVLLIIFTPTANVWTNDAYVQVHYAAIAPRISGKIAYVDVTDNQNVQPGTVLVQLDNQDENIALQQAQAQFEEARAQLANAQALLTRQPALIAQAQAQVTTLQAEIALSQANKQRFDDLARTGAGSVQQRQQADATLAAQQGQLAAAQARVVAAQRQTQVLMANQDAAQAAMNADKANITQAALNLSYTQIRAPIAGTVDALSTQIGNYVSPGMTLMTIVPLSQVYILANYRETALRHVLPGQKVTIHVDAYDIDLQGVVGSLPPTTSAIYSPLPPDNATGNFTKIVQRLPVKILVLPGQPLARLLRVGLSVETTIHTGLANVVGQQAGSPVPATAPNKTTH